MRSRFTKYRSVVVVFYQKGESISLYLRNVLLMSIYPPGNVCYTWSNDTYIYSDANFVPEQITNQYNHQNFCWARFHYICRYISWLLTTAVGLESDIVHCFVQYDYGKTCDDSGTTDS